MTDLKAWSLLGLRVSMGWLLVIWGADKVFNTTHGIAVAEKFYFGFLASDLIMPVAGLVQIAIGLAVVLGIMRSWVYPAQLLLNAASLFAVAASVIDPWGWYLDGTNALFYPSLIIFASSIVLIAFREDDRLCLDYKRHRSTSAMRTK